MTYRRRGRPVAPEWSSNVASVILSSIADKFFNRLGLPSALIFRPKMSEECIVLDPTTAEITIVRGWLAAANEHDVERLLALSLPDIAILDTTVRGSGHEVLRDWVADSSARFTPERYFQREDSVVLAHVEQQSTEAPAELGSGSTPALRFRVRELRVVEVERFEDLTSALMAAGLSNQDEYRAS